MHAKKTIKKPVITNDAIYTQTQNDTIDGDWNWVRNKKQTENPDPGNPANYYESTLSSWETFPALCSGQLKLATALEFFQYRFSDSFGGNPPLYSCGLSAL